MNLNQVTIYSDKPIETVEFFELLGLKRIVDSLPRYARLECGDGGSTLSVHEAETRPVGSVPVDRSDTVREHRSYRSGFCPITLYFECDDLDAEYERLTTLGIKFTEPPTDRPWLWREAYLKDPNGNKICLYHAGENRLDPPWRIE